MTTTKKIAPSKPKKDDPCWKGFEQLGMKAKNGKKVPNCIPEKKSITTKKN